MKTLLAFARTSPWRCLVLVACLLLAAAAEGAGISSLLPLLGIAARGGAGHSEPSGFEALVLEAVAWLGLEPRIEVLLGIVMGAMLVKAALTLLAKRQVGYAVAQVTTDLRLRLIRALLETRWSYFTSQPIGSFSNAFSTEAKRASDAFLAGITMISQGIALLVYTGVAFAVSWRLTLAAVPVALATAALLSRLVRVTRRAGQRQTKLLRQVMDRLADVFQGVKPLKVMAREHTVGPLLEGGTQRLNKVLRRKVLTKEAVATLQETLLMIYVAGGIYVAIRFLQSDISVVFLLALVLSRAFMALNKVQRQYQDLVTDESAYWSMIGLIDVAEREREPHPGGRQPSLKSRIELRDVSFRYGGDLVLDRANVEIPAGRITALIGPSGAGKTTVVDLVGGLLHPEAGEVCVDGVSLDEIDLLAWRRQIGYVPQEMFLLHESVERNVSLGDPEVDPADVEWALRAAGAWEFVCRLPQGVQSFVGERGAQLSGGQRQRIAVARALVRRPKLLILDEAAASLDRASERSLWQSISKLRGETTVLAVSHHGDVLDFADQIYCIEGGKIRELPAPEASPPPAADSRSS